MNVLNASHWMNNKSMDSQKTSNQTASFKHMQNLFFILPIVWVRNEYQLDKWFYFSF